MVTSTSRRKAYQCLGVVAVLGYVLLISRHFSKDTVVILSSPVHTHSIAHTDVFVTESTVNRTSLQFNESDTLPPLTWTNIPTIVQDTKNSNLEMRSKWQRQQVTKFCRKYGEEKQLYVLPPTMDVNRHLIESPGHRIIFCYIPKTGCTNLKRFVLVLMHELPLETINMTKVPDDELMTATKRSILFSKNLSYGEISYKLKNYFKFAMIRNPLERLVSAYRDKIEPPLEFGSHAKLPSGKFQKGIVDFKAHRCWLFKRYHPKKFMQWVQNNGRHSISVSFMTYVQWIIDTPDQYLNEHFSSLPFNAAPCRVGYHLYLNFKNYSREVRLMIKALNASTDYFIDQSSHTKNNETRNTLPYYFSQLSSELKEKLFHRIYKDLDFYYHLYPEDKWSHVELLGVSDTLPLLTL